MRNSTCVFKTRNLKKLPGLLLTIFLTLSFNVLLAQGVQEVKGTVTDSKGNPASGVTVGVKGGSGQTVTDEAGAFSIRAPQKATLTFTSVGFENAEATAEGGDPVTISLVEKASQFTDVVV